MRLIQLKYFLAVCKYGNFSLAAESCYVTQPAVSAAVRELEQEYGVSLFHRKKKQLELTDEGRWFRQRAEFILSYVTATEEQMRICAMNKRYLRVGVAPMIGGSFFYSVYDQFAKEHPEIHIDLLEGGSLQVWQWVQDGIVDIGVQLLDFLPADAAETVKLFDTELVFCVGSSHPLADRESVNIQDLAGQKLILLKEDSYQNKLLKKMFADAGQEIDILMYSNQINSIFSMLSHGSCGAFLFRQMIDPSLDLRCIHLEPPIELSAGLVYRKNVPMHAYMQKLIGYTKAQAEKIKIKKS